MNRLCIFAFVLLCSITSFAVGKGGIVDSSDNILTLRVLPTSDLTRIPVQVSMENPSVPITCVQCYLQVSDTLAAFCRDDEEKSYIYSRTPRWSSTHGAMVAWNTKKHPNSLMVMVISSKSMNFKDHSGKVFSVYFDGSKLTDGKYTMKLFDSNMVWTDLHNITTYLSPDSKEEFYVENGEVIIK